MDDKKTIYSNGSYIITKNKKIHCDYGPAWITPWSILWYLDGKAIKQHEWAKMTKTPKDKMKKIIEEARKYQKMILIEYELQRIIK